MGIFACGDDRCNICYKRPNVTAAKRKFMNPKFIKLNSLEATTLKLTFIK